MRYINESKKVGVVYHYTTINSLLDILKSNIFKSSNFALNYKKTFLDWDKYYICLTRNKNLHKKEVDSINTHSIRIQLDGNKLSNNHKILPYRDFDAVYRNMINDEDESEERIIFKKDKGIIKDIKKYILQIDTYNELKWTTKERRKMLQLGYQDLNFDKLVELIKNDNIFYTNLLIKYLQEGDIKTEKYI